MLDRTSVIYVSFSLILTCVYVFPDIFFILSSKNEFKGISLTGTNDELFYMSRINGIYKDSFNTLGGVDLYEHKSDPWVRPYLGEFVIGNFGKIFRLPLIYTDILTSVLFPVLLFWLFYFLALQLIKSSIIALLAAVSIMFGHNMFSLNLINDIFFSFNYAEPIWFLRPISPTFYYFPLFLALYFIYRTICFNSRFNIWCAGLLTGFLFYLNLFHWTFLYAGMGILLLVSFVEKGGKQIKAIISIYIISIITSIPYWIHFFPIVHHQNYEYLSLKYGMNISRESFLPKDVVISTILVVVLNVIIKRDKVCRFLSVFMMGGLICINQQILTGRHFIPVEWSGYSIKTFSILAICITFGRILQNEKLGLFFKDKFKKDLGSLRYICCVIGISVIIISATIQQWNYYVFNKSIYLDKQEISQAYNWLKDNTELSDVVLIDPHDLVDDKSSDCVREFLTYTNNYSYIPDIMDSFCSKSELEDRIIVSLMLFNYSESEVREFFTFKNGAVFKGVGAIIEHGGSPLDPEYLTYLVDKYRNMHNTKILDSIKKYKIDYILLNKKHPNRHKLLDYSFLKIVYEDDNFNVLKFI